MHARIATILLLLGGCVAPDDADRRIVDDGGARKDVSAPPATACRADWQVLAPGLRHRSLCDEGEAALHLVEIDPDLWTLDAARVAPTTAPALARARRAPFAINANFFGTDGKTLGAIVSAGEIVQRAHPVSWESVFYTTVEGEAGIVLPDAWPGIEKTAAMAVQAGPRIVVGGRRTGATRATPSARSGVCLARDRVIFFATAGRALHDVQQIAAFAAASEDAGGLGCRDAMLFDGGPSAQMHLEGAGISIAGDSVPAFVIASPREIAGSSGNAGTGDPSPAPR
ncbi:MAG TPA: phosphodiester glycosidase family protein [Thermoanaerobaculia bacterium]|nr:phosphodiester glycosidase family protein [Thermoanaerobaculia bacterium]